MNHNEKQVKMCCREEIANKYPITSHEIPLLFDLSKLNFALNCEM